MAHMHPDTPAMHARPVTPTVCLIDTGMAADAVPSGTIVGGINLSGGGAPDDIGTGCARHAADMARTILAHCPGARLVVVRLLDDNGWLRDPGRLDLAFEWVCAHRAEYGITVVCAAVADTSHHRDDSRFAGTRLHAMVMALRAAGVPTVMPAGNRYPQFRLARPHGMAWPAILRGAVSVGALDPDDPACIHPYSQRLPARAGTGCATTLFALPDAPGETSGAAAVVAGRLATLRRAWPDAGVDTLLAALQRVDAAGRDGPSRSGGDE